MGLGREGIVGSRTTHLLLDLVTYFEKTLAMKNMFRHVRQFLANEDGPTAVEYAVMLALIIIVCLAAIQAIGTNANATFNSVAAKLPTGT